MLIVTAQNVTAQNDGPHDASKGPKLVRKDGTADYVAWVGINHVMIWTGTVNGHVRAKGAAALLHMIADRMDRMEDR
jgi:hypothetical protein